MAAAAARHEECAATHIGKGADVNAKTSTGWTPLMEAAETGDVASAKLLLEKGADVNAKAGKKTTALRLAKQRKNDELVKTLQAAGAK
jgi:ankyrin repeat protein